MKRIDFEFNGSKYSGFVNTNEPEFYHRNIYKDLEGSIKMFGVWKHGICGKKKHIEPLVYNIHTNELETIRPYLWGAIIKNKYKYLLKVVE